VKAKKKQVIFEAIQVVPADLTAEVTMIIEALPPGDMPLKLQLGNRLAELRTVSLDKAGIQKIEESVGEYFAIRIEDVDDEQPAELTPSR
jgi:hypothetical protein